MDFLTRALSVLSPRLALDRERNRRALSVLAEMRYDAASSGPRSKSWRPMATDADAASANRQRIAHVARDMVRNTPLAERAKQVIANATIGDGITPSVTGPSDQARARLEGILESFCDTTAIDAHGLQNLYGLQRMAMASMVESGEVFIRRRPRRSTDNLPLPFQIEILEADFLATNARASAATSGGYIADGIEYDRIGRRVAYHFFTQHPGASAMGSRGFGNTTRVAAGDVIHLFRPDRPGQNRGVSWFAPVVLSLSDLAEHQDALLMRQKIAACFAAFRITSEDDDTAAASREQYETLSPGRIQDLAPGEDIRFSDPPNADGSENFTRTVIRSAAMGLGVTYEALSGDLSGVNYSSARMGRLEMDRNVSSWQWLLVIPMLCQRVGEWLLQDWRVLEGADRPHGLAWTPPRRTLVDPTREIPAIIREVRAGFKTRSQAIREMGFDPAAVMAEYAQDNADADSLLLTFDTDPRRVASGGTAQPDQGATDNASE